MSALKRFSISNRVVLRRTHSAICHPDTLEEEEKEEEGEEWHWSIFKLNSPRRECVPHPAESALVPELRQQRGERGKFENRRRRWWHRYFAQTLMHVILRKLHDNYTEEATSVSYFASSCFSSYCLPELANLPSSCCANGLASNDNKELRG